MVTRIFLSAILLITSLMGALPASALESNSPIAVSIFPPVQFPNSDFGVHGLRFGIVGSHRESIGIDLAVLGNVTKQQFGGLAIAGLFNYNSVNATIVGLQAALLANINNPSASQLNGIQIGAYNRVGKVYGIQLGLINFAHELHGIQIGLINFNEGGPFKASPIINAAF